MEQIFVLIKPIRAELLPGQASDEQWVINPCDLKALTQALLCKKSRPLSVTCVAMGPATCCGMLRRCLAAGADEAVLVNDPVFSGSDTYATVAILSRAIEMLGKPQLIFCGERTIDGETGQVPYGLARRLNYAWVDCVNTVSEVSDTKIRAVNFREPNEQVVCMDLPGVVIFHDFDSTYLNVSLLRMKRVRNRQVQILTNRELDLDAEHCGQKGSKTKVLHASSISANQESETVFVHPKEAASWLLDYVK